MCERTWMRGFWRGAGPGIVLLFAFGADAAADFGRDPTQPQPRPGSSRATEAAVPSLTMVHTRRGERRAYINGQWYRVGESVGEYRIAAIARNQVTLVRNDRQYIISVNSQGVDIRRR
ncbi:MAG: hypothetical protein ACQERR_08945 [Pseudomonadota bacterium]